MNKAIKSPFISLRTKLIMTLAISSLIAALLVGLIAKWLVLERFNEFALQRAFQNFSEDVGQYIAKHGSWRQGQQQERFRDFVTSKRPPGEDLPKPGQGQDLPPPFHFVLLDPEGLVIHGPEVYPRDKPLHPKLRIRELPIRISDKLVAYAVPLGRPNLSELDKSYLEAMDRALIYAVVITGGLVLLLGIVFGNQLSNALRRLNTALGNMKPGDLRQQVDIQSRDEVGSLAKVFNRMSSELATAYDQLEDSHRTVSEQATRLHELSIRDELTGLYNRRYFNERAEELFEEARLQARPLSIMIGDIDHFKKINDTFTHAIGDEVLRTVSAIIRDGVRENDVAARYGGEEFVIVFPDTNHGLARHICERLRAEIEAHPWREVAKGLQVTMSIGISSDTTAPGFEFVLNQADKHLYRAKQNGRNRVIDSSSGVENHA